ncbi:MAG TPA: RsmE family RNA methyltransferase [Candidatus Limnocylindrales bacterium]|nr:RsmE family RNA methyltransferase [Candidatus Limnocylindrales bacterium]
MSHRFVVGPGSIAGDRASLDGDQARQIATVLRLEPGERVVLVSDGEEVEVVLDRVGPRSVEGAVVARGPASAEPRVKLVLALPVLKGDRTEEVIAAVTQLGVARIVPYVSARSVVREVGDAKRRRWLRVATEAAETCRRGRVPEIAPLAVWPALFDALPAPVLVAWEGERERALADALRATDVLSLVIGPEGGLEDDEVSGARERGATTVSLGRRNLRSETAAIAAVALAMAALDP